MPECIQLKKPYSSAQPGMPVTYKRQACKLKKNTCNADGLAHGTLLLNSNAMDVVLHSTSVTWRVVGGVLDFYILTGPTPHSVLEQLTGLIGRPVMPPFWALGLMNSKYEARWVMPLLLCRSNSSPLSCH